jgi:hypothetical protein
MQIVLISYSFDDNVLMTQSRGLPADLDSDRIHNWGKRISSNVLLDPFIVEPISDNARSVFFDDKTNAMQLIGRQQIAGQKALDRSAADSEDGAIVITFEEALFD